MTSLSEIPQGTMWSNMAQVGADVESETVHGAPAAVAGTDGANLARPWPVQAGPDAWVALQPPRVVEAEARQCLDDQLFDLVDVTGVAECPLGTERTG